MNFWVQETLLAGTRQSIVHLEDCPICAKRITKGSSDDKWSGPITSLESARDLSYGLWGIAMRSECRCVRSAIADGLISTGGSNDAKAKKHKKDGKAKRGKSAKSHWSRYSVVGTAAVAILTISVFFFPALSVVEASGPSRSSTPFLLANDSPIPLTDVHAECTVELQPASVKLQSVQKEIAGRLDSKNRVTIPCFQSSGGGVPQTSGVIVNVTVKYAVFGIRHLQQKFSFVAARTTDGYCRWVYKT
jgi:hypothetical protein